MSIVWNTGSAAERFRHNLKLNLKNKKKNKKQASNKRARKSLTPIKSLI